MPAGGAKVSRRARGAATPTRLNYRRGALSAATLCEAHPEVCDGTFVGVNMNFPNEGLTRTLPTEIFQYSFITYLGLYGNLSGTIPDPYWPADEPRARHAPPELLLGHIAHADRIAQCRSDTV